MRKGRLPSFTDKKTKARKENNLPKGTELMSKISQEDERVRPRDKLLETSSKLFNQSNFT